MALCFIFTHFTFFTFEIVLIRLLEIHLDSIHHTRFYSKCHSGIFETFVIHVFWYFGELIILDVIQLLLTIHLNLHLLVVVKINCFLDLILVHLLFIYIVDSYFFTYFFYFYGQTRPIVLQLFFIYFLG